jgi:hypothetical protein
MYSIGAVDPLALLVMSIEKGTSCSNTVPSGAKNAPYASPETCAVATTSNEPGP